MAFFVLLCVKHKLVFNWALRENWSHDQIKKQGLQLLDWLRGAYWVAIVLHAGLCLEHLDQLAHTWTVPRKPQQGAWSSSGGPDFATLLADLTMS